MLRYDLSVPLARVVAMHPEMQLPFKRDQIGYAANRGIPILVILGPDEAAGNRLTVRDLRSRRDEFSSRSGQILGIAA